MHCSRDTIIPSFEIMTSFMSDDVVGPYAKTSLGERASISNSSGVVSLLLMMSAAAESYLRKVE